MPGYWKFARCSRAVLRAYLAHPRLRAVTRVVLFPDAGVRTTIKPDDGRNAVHHMVSPLIATVLSLIHI